MAIVTKNLDIRGDGFRIDVDYDDVAMLIDAIHITNGSQTDYSVFAVSTATGRSYTLTVAANSVFNQTVPRAAQTKLGITVAANGRFDGVEWQAGAI